MERALVVAGLRVRQQVGEGREQLLEDDLFCDRLHAGCRHAGEEGAVVNRRQREHAMPALELRVLALRLLPPLILRAR